MKDKDGDIIKLGIAMMLFYISYTIGENARYMDYYSLLLSVPITLTCLGLGTFFLFNCNFKNIVR